MERSAHIYSMVLYPVRLSATIMVSCLACVKTDMEAHEMVRNCEIVYSINREMPYQPITFSFAASICSEYSDQVFISGEMGFQWLRLHYNGEMILFS